MNKLSKRLCLFVAFATFFLITGCAYDDYVVSHPEASGNKSYRMLTGPDAYKKREELVAQLKGGKGLLKLNSSFTKNAVAKIDISDVSKLIDSTEVYEIKQSNGATYYTYRIRHPDADYTTFFNIVLKDMHGYKKTVLVQYICALPLLTSIIMIKPAC